MKIREIDKELRARVIKLIKDSWGSSIIVSRGKVHNIDNLPGFVVIEDNNIVGLVTYKIEDNECEIVSLDSFNENKGIGTRLLERVVLRAREEGCNRVWLITTNDNIRAIRFYQKRDFNMKAIHLNAVEKAREIKPEIPLKGYDDIPILHEIEFEKALK
ncbi:GNAT family N-acetyltransferase [Thermohalobacter berrensis]|uniref:GNAT family N-acetyltransferase n=1 Tax=Thermohalobacter berrensis TaxID=99594 RepID=A0A419T7P7_9FIRM|nr:GNAT family N-acetyltransferase [Thermohalobacter berrensis]RKD33465.1 GNAT family N-acetyltransferase [Thermohalobacter berrensis]